MSETSHPIERFRPPTDMEMEVGYKLMRPFFWLHRPLFFGWEHIPTHQPLLFVGNHTLYGVIDAPIFFLELYRQKKIFLRSLGDHVHFRLPLWRDLLSRYGVVPGTREICGQLMQQGEPILVFPGGGREVAKKKGEKYTLIWKQRMGFARMAIQYGYTIVPFSAVGVEDMFDIVVDSDGILASPFGDLFRTLFPRTEIILPIITGTGPMNLPRWERFYFRFGPPISTAPYHGHHEEEAQCWQLREQTREAVEGLIQASLDYQHADPDRWFQPSLTQLLETSKRWFP